MRAFILATALALFSLVFTGLPAAAPHAADLQSPVGLWKTVDDKTGKPRAIVRIYVEDGKYFGKIEQSFTPGAETRVCSKCTDERKDQPYAKERHINSPCIGPTGMSVVRQPFADLDASDPFIRCVKLEASHGPCNKCMKAKGRTLPLALLGIDSLLWRGKFFPRHKYAPLVQPARRPSTASCAILSLHPLDLHPLIGIAGKSQTRQAGRLNGHRSDR